ncbi:hypothetical protein [Glaciecola petra]|uniref:PEP-CTERM protein-sorting domain-containing protein n=1 Tax=Glaciecola petra TaxID=3075602 RepID=A0ABU2ZRW3_9ALTE|nr:hypothetical protein [Aestuariibacter sp. P117]MDT0595160.1 hypothetical protein [Aestuariibacter sp. P117]
MFRSIKVLTIASVLLASAFSNAGMIYDVSSTPTVNCGSAPHGLWTNRYNNAGCGEYFDFQDGSTLTVDNTQAILSATALNSGGLLATIEITFGGFADNYAHYKNGGTPDYNGGGNGIDWDFYTRVTQGTISFSNGDMFNILLVGADPLNPTDPTGKPVLQVGDGANDKSSGFGASAWLDIYNTNGSPAYLGGQHWDLNMSLSGGTGTVTASSPSILVLLGLGIVGLGFAHRRK